MVMKMYLLQQIEEITIEYNDARKNIAEFILQEDIDLTQFTMQEIANKTYTSKATLVRFAKTLGFSGWNDFMKSYSKEMMLKNKYQLSVDVNLPFKSDDTTDDIINNLCQLQMETLQQTKDLNKVENFKQAATILLNSKRIVVFCVSNNIHSANLFKNKMLPIGIEVIVCENDDGIYWASLLNDNDCAIVISYTGNNRIREPEFFIEILKTNRVKIISITSIGDNYISKNADCCLYMVSKEKLYSKIANFSTEQSLSYLLNCLYAVVFSNNYDQYLNRKVKNAKHYERTRKSILNLINEDKD